MDGCAAPACDVSHDLIAGRRVAAFRDVREQTFQTDHVDRIRRGCFARRSPGCQDVDIFFIFGKFLDDLADRQVAGTQRNV